MYTRWCDSRGFKTKTFDQNVGKAGFKSITFKVTGENSYTDGLNLKTVFTDS